MTDPRMYPDRPYLAVSAAVIRDGRVLVARRAKGASTGLYTLPGGVVEAGETLHQAIVRYSWDGQTANGMLERSTAADAAEG